MLALKLTTNRFQAGTVSYLDLVTAQTIANDKRARGQTAARRLDASMALICAPAGTRQTGAGSSH